MLSRVRLEDSYQVQNTIPPSQLTNYKHSKPGAIGLLLQDEFLENLSILLEGTLRDPVYLSIQVLGIWAQPSG